MNLPSFIFSKEKMKKQIKVLDHPLTFILIDADKDEVEAKLNWLKKHQKSVISLSDEQKRRESISIREGRLEQIKKIKK